MMPSFFSWAAPDLHILEVGKEIFVIGTWFAYRVVDVVIMGTATCLLSYFLGFLEQFQSAYSTCFPEGSFLLS